MISSKSNFLKNFPRLSTGIITISAIILSFCINFSEADAAEIYGNVKIETPKKKARVNQRYAKSALGVMSKILPSKAIVYLEGKFEKSKLTPPSEAIVMGQKNLMFDPAIIPILVGSKVSFPNYDNTYHNVFSYSSTKSFDLGRYQPNEIPPFKLFDKAGVVRVFCEVHNHMRGIILVLESPYFTVTDDDGNYKLLDVPNGDYTLKAWINEKNILSQKINIKETDKQEINFSSSKK